MQFQTDRTQKMVDKQLFVQWEEKGPLVVGNRTFISSSVGKLSKEEVEKAHVELNETEDKTQRYLRELREKLSKEGKYRTDDAFLLRFLRVRKYDCDKSYKNVKSYYESRRKHPEIYGNPLDLSSVRNLNRLVLLPYLEEDGTLIYVFDLGRWEPDNESFEEFMKPILAIVDLTITNSKAQVNGVIGIWNVKGLGIRHCSELMKKNRLFSFTSLAIFTIPWRIKKLVIFNASSAIRLTYNIVRPLISKKTVDRIVLMGSDLSELHQHVNPALLPKRLGGDLEDQDCLNPKLLLDNVQYLEYERTFTGEGFS